MIYKCFKPYLDIIKNQSKNPISNTKLIFKSYVDAVILKTSEIVENQGSTSFLRVLDLDIDEFEVWSLDHLLSLNIIISNLNIKLANATAQLLDIAASQLINDKENKEPINPKISIGEGKFSYLTPDDRFRAITLLGQNKVDITSLPIPFRNNLGLVFAIVAEIAMFATLGYYSEWSGYGLTRMGNIEQRQLEHLPLSWSQVGYPGPSKGYHAFRGYLV